MMVALSNSVFCPNQRLCCVAIASRPSLGCRRVVGCPNWWSLYPIRIVAKDLGTRVCAALRYEGLWEDPDDGSDNSEYEDDSEYEDAETEENDLDYESDWEANISAEAAVMNAIQPVTENYDEALVREVEQMLSPEQRAILEQNEPPNLEKLSTAKWKPLHTFALAGQIKFMDGMLNRGYDIDAVNEDGLTALHLAVVGKRVPVISHLLRKGANPNAKDQDGATPLHYAAQVGALQTVKLLIKYKVDVNVADSEGWTPLHVAMQTRNRDIVKILLVNGADRTHRNQDGNAALDLALCYGKDFKSYDLAKLVKQVPAMSDY